MRPASRLAAAALAAMVAGCAPTPSPSSTSTASAPPGLGASCSGVDLRGPNGAPVDLTGKWEGSSTLWFVTQAGSCVTIEGLSQYANQRDGETHRVVFSGDLRPDFSIPGRWTWTWACNGPACPVQGRTRDVELHVGFAAGGEATIEVPSRALDYDTTFTVTLERIGQSTEFPY